MDLDLSDIDGLCARPRCGLPIAGAGKAYGLCAGHGHEERNRRLAERDTRAKTPTVRPITRGLTTPPVTRPLRAVVGARPTPTPIAPSAASQLAKESFMPRVFKLRPDADLHPELCRTDGCAGTPHIRGVCDGCRATARGVGAYEAIAGPSQRGKVGRGKGESARASRLPPETKRRPVVPVVDTSHPTVQAKINDAERRELDNLRHKDAEKTAAIENLHKRLAVLGNADTALRDELASANDKLQVVVAHLNLDPAADLAEQARDIAAWMSAAIDATNAFGGTTPADLKEAVADAVADTRLDTVKGLQARLAAYERKVMELVDEVGRLDQAHWRTIHDDAVAVASAHQRPPAVSQPASQVFDLHQLGHVHRGPLRGYIDNAGLFRATDGAVYGAIFSAVPVTRPVLGEPTAGDAVWVRTSIAEVTPGGIYLDDGGRMPHGAWQPHRVRPAKAVSVAASFSASALGDAPSDDDDIPF